MAVLNRYHRYVMCAERAMYAAPELKAVICNAEMIKQEIIADFGVPADKITVIYNAIDNQSSRPPTRPSANVCASSIRSHNGRTA